jgi:hypothetical protein
MRVLMDWFFLLIRKYQLRILILFFILDVLGFFISNGGMESRLFSTVLIVTFFPFIFGTFLLKDAFDNGQLDQIVLVFGKLRYFLGYLMTIILLMLIFMVGSFGIKFLYGIFVIGSGSFAWELVSMYTKIFFLSIPLVFLASLFATITKENKAFMYYLILHLVYLGYLMYEYMKYKILFNPDSIITKIFTFISPVLFADPLTFGKYVAILLTGVLFATISYVNLQKMERK